MVIINQLSRVSDINVGDTPKQYYSKWRNRWIDFDKEPTKGTNINYDD